MRNLIAAALFGVLCVPTAMACTGDKALSGANVGQYDYDVATGSWRIVDWYYDAALANTPQYSNEQVLATWTSGGSGGCTGLNCQPNVVEPGGEFLDRTDRSLRETEPVELDGAVDAVAKTEPCRLPEVVVSGVPYSGGSRMMRRIAGIGGIFNLFQRRYTADAPNPSDNPSRATCGSDEQARLYHAVVDFARWRIVNELGGQMVGRGERARVIFDEHRPGVAGSEQYEWIRGRMFSMTAPETWLRPVPGTLNCPK